MYEPQKTGDPKDWGYPWFKIKDVKIHEDHGRKDVAIVTIEDSYRVDRDAAVLGDMGQVLQVKPAILEIENNHPSSKFICTFRGPWPDETKTRVLKPLGLRDLINHT